MIDSCSEDVIRNVNTTGYTRKPGWAFILLFHPVGSEVRMQPKHRSAAVVLTQNGRFGGRFIADHDACGYSTVRMQANCASNTNMTF